MTGVRVRGDADFAGNRRKACFTEFTGSSGPFGPLGPQANRRLPVIDFNGSEGECEPRLPVCHQKNQKKNEGPQPDGRSVAEG